jgi:PAS domain S-box-containing protein
MTASASHTGGSVPAIDVRGVFESLFGAYPDGLLVVDQNGVIVLANPAAEALLMYGPGEMAGRSVDSLVPDSIRPRHASYREVYGRAPRSRPMGTQMELVARRRDGSEVIVEIALSPLQSAGQPLVVAAIRGIGAYPRVRQALQRARYSEQLAQLGRIAVDSRDPQFLLEQVPRIACEALQVEAALVQLLQSDREELVTSSVAGELAQGCVGERVRNEPESMAGHVIRHGQTVLVHSLPTEIRFDVGARFVEAGAVCALAVAVFDRGRAIGVLSVYSCTAQRFGEDEARFLESLANLFGTTLQRSQTEEALNHAQRLESVGQLTGGIAHDFNNLLTVIQGNLQVLEERPSVAGDPAGLQLLAAATRATRRAAELTSKMLAFSRRQVLMPTQVDVGVMLTSLADMLRRTLDQRICIEVAIAQEGLRVVADPVQLESALLNIAINARDAMPAGGRLSFRASPCDKVPASVFGEADAFDGAEAGFVLVEISDDGAGMSDEVKERAFEPFFTTKAAGRGTGLGLSTVYGFVKQSRGALSIDSAPGLGTSVALYLPHPVAAAHMAPALDHLAAAVRPGLDVLLVEDDAEVRSVVQTFLAHLACRVTVASSGEQALEMLGPGAAFDVLLTDIALGTGLRGTELAAQAQQRFPRLGILLMSGYSSELLDADRESPASWELLRKPFYRDDLARAIAAVTVADAEASDPSDY